MWQHMFCVSLMRAVWRRELTKRNARWNSEI